MIRVMSMYHEDIVKQRKNQRRENLKNNMTFAQLSKALGIVGTPEYHKLVETIVDDAEKGNNDCAEELTKGPEVIVDTIVPSVYCVVEKRHDTIEGGVLYTEVVMRIPMDLIKNISSYKRNLFSIYFEHNPKVITSQGFPIWMNEEDIPWNSLAEYNIKHKIVEYGGEEI